MSEKYGRRLPGIDGRLEFTNKFMMRTLRKVRAKTAELIMEMSRLRELHAELESYAHPEHVSDEAAAIKDFNDLAEAIFEYCYDLRDKLSEEPLMGPLMGPAEPEAPNRLPPEPRKN